MTFFAMGAWLSMHLTEVLRVVRSLTAVKRSLGWALGLVLYAYCFNGGPLSVRALGDIGLGLGSSILVALSFTLRDNIAVWFGRWLGKICL
jgi:hypothetical protein